MSLNAFFSSCWQRAGPAPPRIQLHPSESEISQRTKDPRWHWLEVAWDASEDASVRELATFVREHRVTLADELAGHVR